MSSEKAGAPIGRAEIEKVARLSRLSLSPDEAELYAGQIAAILGHVQSLNAVDTTDVPPTSHALALVNVFREDVPAPSLKPEEALANAPESESGCFKVPPIIQG